MKKAIAFVLVLMIILGMAACGAVKESKNSKTLYAHGLDVIHMLSEMTQSENFIGIYTATVRLRISLWNLAIILMKPRLLFMR